MTFATRLEEAQAAGAAPVCVGLDPVLERLPDGCRGADALDRLRVFSMAVVVAAADAGVPVLKPQLACFERYGPAGFALYAEVAAAAREAGLLVIADAKRGDIGISAAHYAHAFLGEASPASAVTVNPLLGFETVTPFLNAARRGGGAVFVLTRTSNPGGDDLQMLAGADGRTATECVADYLTAEAKADGLGTGEHDGYGAVGAVVGATRPEDAAALRLRMPGVLFLVPGYGAQGGGLDAVRACLDERGRGAIITASRSVLYPASETGGVGGDWQQRITDAARRLADEVGGA